MSFFESLLLLYQVSKCVWFGLARGYVLGAKRNWCLKDSHCYCYVDSMRSSLVIFVRHIELLEFIMSWSSHLFSVRMWSLSIETIGCSCGIFWPSGVDVQPWEKQGYDLQLLEKDSFRFSLLLQGGGWDYHLIHLFGGSILVLDFQFYFRGKDVEITSAYTYLGVQFQGLGLSWGMLQP